MVFCVLHFIPKYMCSFRWINIHKLTDVGMTKGTRVQTLLIWWLSEFLKHVSSQLWFPVTSGTRTANPPDHMSLLPVFVGFVLDNLQWFVDRCFPFVTFLLDIVLSVPFQITASDYPFDIIKCSLNILTGGYTVRYIWVEWVRPCKYHYKIMTIK